MASSTRLPLCQASAIKINVIFWIWCLCVVTCYSAEDLTSGISRNTHKANSLSDADIRLASAPLTAITSSARKEENGCSTCHLTKATVRDESSGQVTSNKPTEVTSTEKFSRQQRSIQEEENEGHSRPSRAGALNKNFLRFGRGDLNKNFLRFGRGGSLRENFLRFGRGGLQKNFLRFGRKDQSNSGENFQSEDLADHDSLDLQSSTGTEANLLRAIERLQSEIEEDNNAENQDSNGKALAKESFSEVEVPEEYGTEDQSVKTKRGSLNNNFLRFGRLYKPNMFSGKRGSLNRNFLRFGKRSGPPITELEDGASTTSTSKVKREASLTKHASSSEMFSQDINKKSVLFLASPWLSKNGSVENIEPRKVQGNSIRRRSIDAKLLSKLQSNFIRFGRR